VQIAKLTGHAGTCGALTSSVPSSGSSRLALLLAGTVPLAPSWPGRAHRLLSQRRTQSLPALALASTPPPLQRAVASSFATARSGAATFPPPTEAVVLNDRTRTDVPVFGATIHCCANQAPAGPGFPSASAITDQRLRQDLGVSTALLVAAVVGGLTCYRAPPRLREQSDRFSVAVQPRVQEEATASVALRGWAASTRQGGTAEVWSPF